jgi:chitinase
MKRFVNFVVVAAILVSFLLVTSANAAPGLQVAAWQPNTSYAVGNLVTYGGQTYECLQAHTSLTGWEPPNVPALWKLVSGGVTNTPTQSGPTATTAPATNTPTAIPTGSGTCTEPAWNANTVYTSGNLVSWNNREWRAKWWTQGEEPGTTGQWGVWEDRGSCSGSVTPTNTPVSPTNTPISPTNTPVFSPTPGGGTGGDKVIGYFAQWGVYGRNYHVKNIATSGSASKLTHIMYAFGNVQNGRCVIGDAYADYDRFYSAAESVDGVADTWDSGALRGNFNQLRKLKQMYPNIKVVWSFGGWTWSGGFGQAAANPAAFAQSCYDLVYDPRWADVFDGIDIDWEYPNACGLTCDTSGFDSYRNLMSALRAKFGPNRLVTAAIPAGYANINAADYGGASQYVDFYMVMTYDFFGAWANTGPTAPHSPLYSYSGIPQNNFYSDYAIQLLKSKGIPSEKLLLGVGFYGRGWTGVSNVNGGLNQPASGAAQGTYEPGIEDYKVLVNTCPATGTVAGTAYAYCNGNWWSYDTPATMAGKMNYMKSQNLGGVFFWELSGDTPNGSLITALYNNR